MKKTFSILTISLILMVTGCAKHDLPPNYVGTWLVGGSTLVLNKNNTYQLTNTSAIYASTGTYSVSGTNMLFKDNPGICNDSIVGTYNFNYVVNSLSGTFYQQLTLTVLSDGCSARSAALPGTYIMPNK